jgi:hypothetical protein
MVDFARLQVTCFCRLFTVLAGVYVGGEDMYRQIMGSKELRDIFF